jgi:hypothetical protein
VESFKIKNFEREYGVNSFPGFRSLDAGEAYHIFSLLKERLGLPPKSSGLDVLDNIGKKATALSEVDAAVEMFDLCSILAQLEFVATKVFVNWDRFEKIDEFGTKDLCQYFTDIFYPSADDLEIMDVGLTWLLSIRHYGTVKALVISA